MSAELRTDVEGTVARIVGTDHLMDKLDAIEHKLDYVAGRQRYVEELIDELMPVGRQVMTVAGTRLVELEQKGYFAAGNELLGLVDRVVTTYSAEEIRALSDNVVGILDTVRNLTQPDVLAVANDATDVLHHASEVAPVGVFGALRATRDDNVQRGMAIALQILEQLGKARTQEASSPPRRPAQNAGLPPNVPPRAEAVSAPKTLASAEPAKVAVPTAAEAGVVMWEGHAFTPEGFLVDPNSWDRDLGSKIAAGLGITLTHDHWTVIDWIRHDYFATGSSPNVRRAAMGSGVGTAAMYELFPKTPGKSAAMVAGVKKPVGCV